MSMKDERDIMSTNFKSTNRTSDVAKFGLAPGPGQGLLHRKTLLWLALPLALAAGCASDPSRSTVAFSGPAAPIVAPGSEREAANQAVGNEIFNLFMTDTSINYLLRASVDNGVVTLIGASSNRLERQRVVDRVWELAGVNQVKDELGVDLAPTLPRRAVVVR
jgi:hypothetical protein